MRNRILVFFVSIILVLPVFSAQAEEGDTVLPAVEPLVLTEAQLAVRSSEELIDASASLSALFYRGLSQYNAGKFGEAARLFGELEQRGLGKGYRNLSPFSFELLSQAKVAERAENAQSVRFLVHWAEQLSPGDGRVLLGASSFSNSLGLPKAVEYIVAGLSKLTNHPLTFTRLGLAIWMVALVGATLATFVVCVVQLVTHSERILTQLTSAFPMNFQGIMGPLTFLVVLIAPLFFGFLVALGVWALVLSRYQWSCQWLGAFAGVLILAWVFSVPIVERLGEQVAVQANESFENINNATFDAKDGRFIVTAMQVQSEDPVVLFSYAQMLLRENQTLVAKNILEKVIELGGGNNELTVSARMNMAAALIVEKDHQGAELILSKLEKQGVTRFELYYNLSQSYLGLLDTVKHRSYFNKARESDPAKLEWYQKYSKEQQAALTPLPWSTYYPRLLKPVGLMDFNLGALRTDRRHTLLSSFIVGGSVTGLIVFGLIVAVSGFVNRLRIDKYRAVVMKQQTRVKSGWRTSGVWQMLPAGGFIAGERPFFGAIMLALFISFVIAGFEKPIGPFNVLPVDAGFQSFYFWAAGILFVLVFIAARGAQQRQLIASRFGRAWGR